ncbi:MAG: hypothetical protein K9K32_00035 [Halanaerobiales bacterium]|nr:hypothetical protein [Halanaerobiales bacterium]
MNIETLETKREALRVEYNKLQSTKHPKVNKVIRQLTNINNQILSWYKDNMLKIVEAYPKNKIKLPSNIIKDKSKDWILSRFNISIPDGMVFSKAREYKGQSIPVRYRQTIGYLVTGYLTVNNKLYSQGNKDFNYLKKHYKLRPYSEAKKLIKD